MINTRQGREEYACAFLKWQLQLRRLEPCHQYANANVFSKVLPFILQGEPYR